MTSITRSTRRTEGHQRTHHPHHLVATHTRSQRPPAIALQQANSRTAKRPFEPSAHDFDPIKAKRARFTVEIISKPQFQQQNPSESIAPRHHPPPKRVATQRSQQQPAPTPYSAPSTAVVPPPAPPATATRNTPILTKSQEKARNGLRHELDKLQPSAADIKPEGRKLRSQEATRFKSELSAYFPDYDEVIGNDPKEHHILNLETPIVVVESTPTYPAVPLASPSEHSGGPRPSGDCPVRSYPDALFTDLHDSQRIDFGFLETRYKGKTPDDPLPDSYFEPAHKKAERLERSIRNSEKGRAQHEKDQIIRLLEGLQGPDWLRTMGVSGVTESRKKQFEPARAHFIKGCHAILEKFRRWSLEEKRRKLEKERVLAEQAKASEEEGLASDDEAEDEGAEDDDNESDEAREDDEPAVDEVDDSEAEPDEANDVVGMSEDDEDASEGDPPDLSDVDASIAKQLREEAMARSRKLAAKAAAKRPPPPSSPEPYKEFTSFFKKRYQREAALNQNRRRGRTVMAWGLPVPEPPEADFDLPEEYRDEKIVRANARRRRRDKRDHGR
ncbi:Something about silencing domain containing-protein [Pleurostoma richardsiae]|uniref:Something about silencing domain containing-protein n=1 Tax=Pleurostoma richardsiae TaxID=41990 RepID=A0AA38S167_9PEZI|nr:Something about silencing domain containing-protein [Pleurostoma richardsiae]